MPRLKMKQKTRKAWDYAAAIVLLIALVAVR
jgi:hypothetical protein